MSVYKWFKFPMSFVQNVSFMDSAFWPLDGTKFDTLDSQKGKAPR